MTPPENGSTPSKRKSEDRGIRRLMRIQKFAQRTRAACQEFSLYSIRHEATESLSLPLQTLESMLGMLDTEIQSRVNILRQAKHPIQGVILRRDRWIRTMT